MGNCAARGDTAVTAAGAGGGEGEDGRRRRRRWKAPLEDQLGTVPGRIFSNDGRSRTASVFTQQGRKGINQDAMLIWDGFGGEEDGVLCGVFDGHGPHGHLVARRVRDSLPLRLMSAARASPKSGLDMPAAAWRKAFTRAYKAMDKDLRSHPSLDSFCSGSTAVTVLKLGTDLYMANIGDSRAVLGSRDAAAGGMAAVQLTVDLKPDVPSEAERIKKCRGRVFALQDEPEVPRVWLPFDDAPGLAMARAFGDFCLKDYGVISVPEFFHWPLTDKDQFVILASDGELGGLGIRDLERAGLALRIRWLWFSRTDPGRAWHGLDLQFSSVERALFAASTYTNIGNGLRALFWEDRWLNGQSVGELMPALYNCIPKRRRKVRSVADGLNGNAWARDIHGILGIHEIGQYLQLWHLVQSTSLSNAPDQLIWKWTANGSYSAQSCYAATFLGSTHCSSWKLIWKPWAPPRVKFFHWLANLDRCWTADRLARHGLQHHPRCLLCDQEPETIQHLFLDCPFARQVWHETLAWLRIPTPIPNQDPSLMDWWQRARGNTPQVQRKAAQSVALLVPWMVWKHRNSCVFDNATPSLDVLMARIKEEVGAWAMAGATGLRVVLPPSWDVH